MVHPTGGLLEVGKGSQHKLRIGLLVVQARRARFSTATSLRNNFANAVGSVFPGRRYVDGCMKVICGREDLAYVPP
jgi:hypothetical protein